MELGRRAILVAGLTLATAAAETPASACTLIPRVRPKRFDDVACRLQINELVELLDRAHSVDEAAIDVWLKNRGVAIDDALIDSEMGYRNAAEFVKNYKMSGGKLDTKPIQVIDITLVKKRQNQAAYAFVLRRYAYNPADLEGCNGLLTHGEYWAYRDAGYIAAFTNNEMETFRAFPEWFADSMPNPFF